MTMPIKQPGLDTDQQEKVKRIIQALHQCYKEEPGVFDFHCSRYIAGDQNKIVRQEIVRQVTGMVLPARNCGMHFVADKLKAFFQQAKLF